MDSHIGLPKIEKTLEELEQLELLPFKAAIEQGAQAIMSAHILFPQIEKSGVPGTMSYTIITEILKEKLGYKGLVVSDCLEMNAIKRFYGTAKGALGAVKAGIDLVFISHTPEMVKEAVHLIEEAVATGDLDEAVIDAAVTKILAYKAQYATIEKLDYEVVGCDVHRRANELMRTETICHIKGEFETIQPGDDRVLFIGSYSYRTDLASSSVNQDLSFPQYMGEQFNAAYEIIDIDPSEELINAMLQKVQGYKHIVIGLFNARENKGQLALVQKLLAAGCKVTAITLGRPYDLPLIEGEFCGIAAFEYTLDAFKSLLPILNGEVVPTANITIQM
ncbi:putative lipoprotein YbbD precursor [compost metagenome]